MLCQRDVAPTGTERPSRHGTETQRTRGVMECERHFKDLDTNPALLNQLWASVMRTLRAAITFNANCLKSLDENPIPHHKPGKTP